MGVCGDPRRLPGAVKGTGGGALALKGVLGLGHGRSGNAVCQAGSLHIVSIDCLHDDGIVVSSRVGLEVGLVSKGQRVDGLGGGKSRKEMGEILKSASLIRSIFVCLSYCQQYKEKPHARK